MSSPSSRRTSSEERPLHPRAAAPDVAAKAGRLPPWEADVARLLTRAQREAAVVSRSTPKNLERELTSLEQDFRVGREREPRFAYEPASSVDLVQTLARAATTLRAFAHPLAHLYADRADELALELRLCATIGTAAFRELARERFATSSTLIAAADELAAAWIAQSQSTEGAAGGVSSAEPRVRSCDLADPRSLHCRLAAELGRRKWAVRIVVTDRIASLAATGDGVLLVAKGKMLTLRDIERTVLHELEGHAAPRERATGIALGLFRLGTARGTDDQEGRALWLEERAGHLDTLRRRELALRHRACRTVDAGATFVETSRALVTDGAELEVALRIAARAHRGGGFGRERVYLPAYLATRAKLAREPDLDRVLGSGRVALDAARALEPWLEVRPDGATPR